MEQETFKNNPKQIGEWIKIGIKISADTTIESRKEWFTRIKFRHMFRKVSKPKIFEASANGFLLIGYIGDVKKAYNLLEQEDLYLKKYNESIGVIVKLTGIDKDLIEKIANANFNHRLSATKIAQELIIKPEEFLTLY